MLALFIAWLTGWVCSKPAVAQPIGEGVKVDLVFYIDLSESTQECSLEPGVCQNPADPLLDPPPELTQYSFVWNTCGKLSDFMDYLEDFTDADYEFTIYWFGARSQSACDFRCLARLGQRDQPPLNEGGVPFGRNRRSMCHVVEIVQGFTVVRNGQSISVPPIVYQPKPPCLDEHTTWGAPKRYGRGLTFPCQFPSPLVPMCPDENFFPIEPEDYFAEAEDWGAITAYVSWYHQWREENVCDSYRRFFVPISSEPPRCGVICDGGVPSFDEPEGGADWRVSFQAGVCARVQSMAVLPIIHCCAIRGIENGGGQSAGPNGFTPEEFCESCNQRNPRCVFPVANLLAGLSLGVPLNATDPSTWPTNLAYGATGINLGSDPFIQLFVPIAVALSSPVGCDPIDFDNNNIFPDDEDLIAFLIVNAGGQCPTGLCNDIDFNNDCLYPSDLDLAAFLRVLAGGTCEE